MPTTRYFESVHELAGEVHSGMTVAIGGFLTTNKPIALLRAIVERGVRDLTVVACHGSMDIELLILGGCVKTLICPYVGYEDLAPVGPHYRRAIEAGEVEVIDLDAGMILSMLQAAHRGIPFMPTYTGLGTDLAKDDRYFRKITDPFTGKSLGAVPALEPDVALLHVPAADEQGYLYHAREPFSDLLMAQASKATLATTEANIDPTEPRYLGRASVPAMLVTGFAVAPGGAQPLGCQGAYGVDEAGVREFLSSAQ